MTRIKTKHFVLLSMTLTLAALGCQPLVESEMQSIENQVAEDAVEQYGIVERSGSAMDRCMQAGMVAAAYLQAENEEEFAEWKDVERADCEEAGVPID